MHIVDIIALMSPVLSGCSSDALKRCNRIIFSFYLELSHILCILEIE